MGSAEPEREIQEEPAPSIWARGIHAFLVPITLAAACVGLFFLAGLLLARERSVEDLLAELRSGGGDAQAYAAVQLAAKLRALRDKHQPVPESVVPALTELLKSTPPANVEAREYLVACLGLTGDPRATETIVKLLREDPSAAVKARCLEALGAVGDPSAAPAVREFLDHESPSLRKYAVFNLAALAQGAPPAAEAIRRKLEDPSDEVRWNAAFGLAYFLQDPAGAKTLRRMLDRGYLEGVVGQDPKRDELVRHAMKMACRGLGALEDRESLDLLRRTGRDDPDYEVRRAALDAAARMEKGK